MVKDNPRDLSNENDDRLLVLIGAKSADPDIVREAWAEFFRRHSEYLYRRLHRAATGIQREEHSLRDLVSETFRHVYEQAAATFRPSGSTDPDQIRRHVRAWLGRVAHRLFQESLRGHSRRERVRPDEYWENVAERQQPDTTGDSNRVREIVCTILNEKEQEILRVRMQYYDVAKDHKRLPPEVLADLSRRLDMKPDAIRKAYERILEKIKDALTRPGSAKP